MSTSQTDDALVRLLLQLPAAADSNESGLRLLFVGTTLVFYDYILTVGDEFSMVWSTTPRFSFTKLLFFLNRYYTFANCIHRIYVELSDTVVSRALRCELESECLPIPGRYPLNWMSVSNWVVVESLMLMCVWCLWGQSKRIGYGLMAACVGLLVLCVMLRDVNPGSVRLARLEPPWLFSDWGWDPVSSFWIYLCGAVMQLISFGLFIVKTRPEIRPSYSTTWTLGHTLRLHCIIYYSLLLMLMGLGFLSSMNSSLFLPLYTAQITIPAMSLIANRLILALREVVFVNQNAGETTQFQRPWNSYQLRSFFNRRNGGDTYVLKRRQLDTEVVAIGTAAGGGGDWTKQEGDRPYFPRTPSSEDP